MCRRFSAVAPVIGWNQCVKCVAPRSSAQCIIAVADRAGNLERQLGALFHRAMQRAVHLRRQAALHFGIVNTSEPNALYAVVSSICMGSPFVQARLTGRSAAGRGAKLPAMRRLPRGALLAPDRVFPMVPHPPHNCNASGEIC